MGGITRTTIITKSNKTIKNAIISDKISGDNTIVSAMTGKKIKVFAILLTSTGTVKVKWKDGTSTDLTGASSFQAEDRYALSVSPPHYIFCTSAGNALILNLSAGVEVDGFVSYWDNDDS